MCIHPKLFFIKIKNDTKLDKNWLKIKLHRNPTLEKSDLFEFKSTLFDNINPGGFLVVHTELLNVPQGFRSAWQSAKQSTRNPNQTETVYNVESFAQ